MASAAPSSPATDVIAARMAAFVRLLRDRGFALGLKETQDALRVAAALDDPRPGAMRAALRCLLCSRRTDWEEFDALFDAFWLGRGGRRAVKVGGAAPRAPLGGFGEPRGPQARETGPGAALMDTAAGESPPDPPDGGDAGKAEGASRVEISAATDFRRFADPAQMAQAHAAAEGLARVMRARLTRRERARLRGRRVDLRSTIRRSTAHGGVPLDLFWRARKPKPLKLVVLLDASGSMQLYTAVFARFIHGVLDSFREAEAFLFHTRLAHVSQALRERDPQRALERLSLLSQGVGGGTRIGESLQTFNQWHARRTLGSRSCVMILSDGYDTGDPGLLAAELQRLRRRCRRIVWLNPMMGWEGFAPEARAIKAALPHIDLLAPAHSLESLAALEPVLARI
jgi:uncharacterized protein with von Willebrand factor type A (vWA) domain